MAEMKIGYGSEYQLLRYLGHHRKFLYEEITKVVGVGEIDWLDYPNDLNRDSRDGELKGIECFRKLINFDEIEKQWKVFWPQSGNAHNWDGIFIQNGIWYFVEAKANLKEANQKCSAESKESIEIITQAFEETCGCRKLAEEWQSSNCYQLANRLAFIHFCKKVGIKAKLLYISFINGYDFNPQKNVDNKLAWENKWNEEYKTLRLTDDLKSNIVNIYIDCHKDGRRCLAM